ncbi:FoF1 ATP synthase subunit gamma [Methylococcus sp. EFPC2]|uniref:F0F1 ATP synthase subunit gamma n=1 Tax=Methylococcus sp. EFPC2 TaxID=2812648 RepID=UPI001967FB8B|nr:FoF1 ATP synthase subunit gamma [Methylococcus sp. EFPC2]QSA98696.1 F0F1 ATP synthase subunit gamma [Methylococcus sp. EFPC2]
MSRRHALEAHRHTLGEVRDIMDAMKNLALMEIRKLERHHANQRVLVDDLRRAASDLLAHHPLPHTQQPNSEVHVLFGAERGFCGGFNEALRVEFDTLGPDARCIAVGQRLYTRLEDDPRVLAALDGASMAEEIGIVLERLVQTLGELPDQGPYGLTALYHEPEAGVTERRLLPLYLDLQAGDFTPRDQPPVINLPPAPLLAEFGEYYLLALLHRIACASLQAENQLRIQHLGSAVHRLDNRLDELDRECNALRQEEITEEIEVLLLNMSLV